MSKKENNLIIVYAGRYSANDILSGPELMAKSIYAQHCMFEPSVFIQYFFDGRKYSIMKKLFGKAEDMQDTGKILTLGIFRIIPELRKIKPDIIHLITFERFALIFYIYRLLFRVKIIYNSHGVIEYENKVLRSVPAIHGAKDKFSERVFLKYSDKVIFPSVNTLNIAEKYYSFDEDKAIILPNGIDAVFFNKKDLKGTANRLRAVIHNKNTLNSSGIKLLLETLTTVNFPLDVYIITNTEIMLPQNNGINYITTSQMGRSELAEFYKDKDIFLSLNHYDTFSIGTAEAMASGLIPVVTTETGISRYIEYSVNGFTFDHHFKADLVKILSEIINMPRDKRAVISISAHETVKNLTWRNIYEMYVPICNGMSE